MNTTTAPAPSLQHAPADALAGMPPRAPRFDAAAKAALADDETLDLDTRIQRAERRLLAREAQWLDDFESLTTRVQQNLHPRQLMKPVLGAGVAALGMWWALRGRKGVRHGSVPHGAQAGGQAPQARHGAYELPWVRLLGLAWPLMPARLRDRVSPATASTVLSLGLPMAERLLAKRVAPPLVAMQQVDLAACAGTWFVVARMPSLLDAPGSSAGSGGRRPRLRVLPQLDGSIRLVHRSQAGDGSLHDVQGLAKPEPASGGARLSVSVWPQALRWLPMAWQQLSVLHVDADGTEALVGSPDRRALWMLARRPRLAEQRAQALVQLALDRGYAVERLQFTDADT